MQKAFAASYLEFYTHKSTFVIILQLIVSDPPPSVDLAGIAELALVVILQLFVSSRGPSVDLAGEAEVTDAGPRF